MESVIRNADLPDGLFPLKMVHRAARHSGGYVANALSGRPAPDLSGIGTCGSLEQRLVEVIELRGQV